MYYCLRVFFGDFVLIKCYFMLLFIFLFSECARPDVMNIKNLDEDVESLLNTPIVLDTFNPSFNESHVHELFCRVAAVVMDADQLVVIKARVIGIHKSKSELYFYTVRRPSTSSFTDYVVPMWTVFKYQENAEWVLNNVYETDEKANLLDFFKKTSGCIDQCRKELFPHYVDMMINKSVPKPVYQTVICMKGGSLVFSTYTRLESHEGNLEALNTADHVEDEGFENTANNVLSTVTKLKPQIMFSRLVDHAAESLAVLYISRLKGNNAKPSYRDAYDLMRKGEYFYSVYLLGYNCFFVVKKYLTFLVLFQICQNIIMLRTQRRESF